MGTYPWAVLPTLRDRSGGDVQVFGPPNSRIPETYVLLKDHLCHDFETKYLVCEGYAFDSRALTRFGGPIDM